MADAEFPDARNFILASLTDEDRWRVAPHLRRTELEHHLILHDTGLAVEHVYFPESGMVSLLATTPAGPHVEVAVVGVEGMCGMSAFHRVPTAADRAIVQAPGVGYSMKASTFASLIDETPSLRAKLHSYAFALLALTAQASACNRRHGAAQRLARWLLLAHDRIGVDVLPLTHQFLSQMLGVRRSTVTLAADELRTVGVIGYSRGRVEILDREGLEAQSCGCYRAIVDAFSNAQVPIGVS